MANRVGDLPRLHQTYRFGGVAKEAALVAHAGALQPALKQDASASQTGLQHIRKNFNVTKSVTRLLSAIGLA